MIPIAVTQRVVQVPGQDERRDCLDQRWAAFLFRAGLHAVAMPNDPDIAQAMMDALGLKGLLLTGGDDLGEYGGATPERDLTERRLLSHALSAALPVIGVCRGMQLIQHHFGIPLEHVSGHIQTNAEIIIGQRRRRVNSFHSWGARSTQPELTTWATSQDGVIKGIRHATAPLLGIMWHPERLDPIRQDEDIDLFSRCFVTGATPAGEAA